MSKKKAIKICTQDLRKPLWQPWSCTDKQRLYLGSSGLQYKTQNHRASNQFPWGANRPLLLCDCCVYTGTDTKQERKRGQEPVSVCSEGKTLSPPCPVPAIGRVVLMTKSRSCAATDLPNLSFKAVETGNLNTPSLPSPPSSASCASPHFSRIA